MKNLYISIPLLTLALAAGTTTVAQSVKPRTAIKPMQRVERMAEPIRTAPGAVVRGGADDCASATVLTSGTDCVPTAFSTAAATQDMDPIECGGFTSPDALDVFFSFVATSETQAITVNGFEAADAVLELLEGDCGSLVNLACADATFPGAADETTTEEILQGGLTIGTTYYIRVYDYGHGSDLHNFDICVTEGIIAPPPANDLCEDVTPADLALGASVAFNGNNIGATDTEGLGMPNVWHAFTITECADLVIDYCGTAPAFGNGFTALYMGCPNVDDITANDFDDTTCPDGNFSLFYNTVPAGTYYYAVMLDAANGAAGDYTINVTASAAVVPCPDAPANDMCMDATVLTAGMDCVPTTFSTAGATQDMDPILCGGFTSPDALDVFFTFVATAETHAITVNGFEAADAVLELLEGDCGSLVSLACADATFPGAADETTTEEILQGGFTIGNTYYVRVYDYAHGSDLHNFDICVTEGFIAPPPANDLCEDVTPVDLALGASVAFTGNNIGATDTEGLGMPNVWHAFTITECADLVIDYCGTAPAFGNGFTALYMGCPNVSDITANSFDDTTCPDGNFSLFYNSVPAGTYYYAVMLDAANGAAGDYTINVTASAAVVPCPEAPANDMCAGAMMLTSMPTCETTAFTTAGATEDLAPILCNGFTSPDALDVYFTFVATAEDHTITVNGFAGADAVLEFFTGDCNNLVAVGCTDDTFPASADEDAQEVMVQSGLEIGTTYTVRVYDYAHGSDLHNFDICVTGDIIDAISENNASAWSIFPNPANGMFNIQYAGESGLGNVEVFDVAGRTVYAERAQLNNGAVRTIELNGVSAGSYTVRITMNGVQTAQRLLVD